MFGTTRAYVAMTSAELFPGQSTVFAQRFSRTLVEGWCVDTNLYKENMRRVHPAAVAAAGLKRGNGCSSLLASDAGSGLKPGAARRAYLALE